MKKVLLSILAVMFMAGIAHADLYKTKRGPTVLWINNTTSYNTTLPTAGTGLDMSNYEYALLDVIGASNGSAFNATLTPLFTTNGYIASGSSVSLTQNERYIVDVNGCQDFNIRINSLSGAASPISVYVTGLTE
jgi:uncharacterized protein YxeA